MRRRKTQVCLALLFALVFGGRAPAEVLALPAALTALETEAFAGNAAISEVIVPEGVAAIGDGAFRDCENLGWITLPASAEALGSEILDDCAEDLLIRTVSGSAAMAYAQYSQIDYQADTRYRALLVAQSYEASAALETLSGPANDAAALSTLLPAFDGTPYEVTIRSELTASGILSAIDEVLGGASSQDVSLFYYSGHGRTSSSSAAGALVGVDNANVTAAQLRSAMDRVPGRKILIIDACYAGVHAASALNTFSASQVNSMPATDSVTYDPVTYDPVTYDPVTSGAEAAEDFLDAFISTFSRRSRSAAPTGAYFVLAAAAEDEESYEGSVSGKIFGLFTYYLMRGAGYSPSTRKFVSAAADANGNGVLTLDELYQYTYGRLSVDSIGQHVQVYPTGCGWFGMLRQ